MDLVTAHGIEKSKVFLVLVTKAYMTDKGHKNEIAYAKALGKPFALVIEEGVDLSDWFDGCDVIGRVTFDRNNFNNKQVGDWLKSLLKRPDIGK